MVAFTSVPNRQTLCLWAFGAAVLLCAGCQELGRHRSALESHFGDPLPHYPTFEIVNAGYSETNWNSLAPTAGSHMYFEHYDQIEPYVDDIQQRPVSDGEIGLASTPPNDLHEASSSQPSDSKLVPTRLEVIESREAHGGNQPASFVDDVQDTRDFGRP